MNWILLEMLMFRSLWCLSLTDWTCRLLTKLVSKYSDLWLQRNNNGGANLHFSKAAKSWKCKFKPNTNTYQCNLKVFKKKSTWCRVPNSQFYKLDSRRWRKSSLMLSCPTDTEKVSGLKIKLIPNPSCWLYFGWKSFSHWRQSWIFIMGFEMDPKSSELHIWSKDMVTCQLYR